MAASLAKRMGFARTNTAQGTELPTRNQVQPENGSSIDGVEDEKSAGAHVSSRETELEANEQLRELKKKHRWDPNLPKDTLFGIEDATEAHDLQHELNLVDALTENSPYPEVRAAVRNYDEDVPASTFRMWAIGLILCTIGSALNMLFSMRAPSLTISSLVAQLVAYPIGVGWSMIFPDREFKIGRFRFNMNPGPFNIKEHTVIVVMANVSFGNGVAYSTDTILAQRAFYGQNYGFGWEILFTLSTQMLGYGIAGIMRKFLVEPGAMIWPYDLVNTALFYALHDHSKTDPAKTHGWSISRYRYFFYVFLGSFVWYWFPGWIAQFLSVFTIACWIRPNNVVINQIFGGWTGMSLIPITFDWTQVTGYIQSPLVAPWHAIGNVLIGLTFFVWIVATGIHFSGGWYGAYLPFSDSSSYDNTANPYNVSRILTSEYTLDVAKYEAYSPLFLSTTFALAYGLSFAAISAVIIHTALFNGVDIWERIKAVRGDDDDIHTRMMRKYPNAPTWWYAAIMVIMLAVGLVTSLAYDTHLSWWAFLIAVLIAFVWTVPIGMIQATTNVQLGLNVFTEFIIGYMQPGRPLAMMMFKTYGYITMAQALTFVQDLKLGHYMKVPPRTMFKAQVVATIWASFVQIAVLTWALNNIEDVCTKHQKNNYTCPNGRVFFNASIIWGLIGPARLFSGTSIYAPLQYFWLIGCVTPVLIYIGARVFPRSSIRYLNAPLIFGGFGALPPATPLNFLSWGLVGFVFNKYIRNRYRGWWLRFNYITSAGLDVGLALSTIIIFLALQLTNQTAPQWWGNVGALETMDYQGPAIQKAVPDGETFGPTKW